MRPQLFTPYVLWLSVAAILYGGLTALAQTDLKKLVAYSSVAHMGFATLGIFALNQLGIQGAVLVMINHGVTTGALFIVVGIIYERLHTRDLAETAGMGKTMPIFALFAGRVRAFLAGLPRHEQLHRRVPRHERRLQASPYQPDFMVMMICVVPGVVLAAAYMLRMLQKVAYGGTQQPRPFPGLKDLGLREILTLAPLLVFVFWIGLHPEPFTRVLDASVKHLLEQTHQAHANTTYAIQP